MIPRIGVLEGRLTPAEGRGIQFFPDAPGEWGREFKSARGAGLDSIELLARPTNLAEHPLMSAGGRKRIAELSQEHGIVIPSVHAYFSKDEQYADDLLGIVTATAQVDARTVLISFFKERKLSPEPDADWEHAHRLIAPAARRAKEIGVCLGIEAELPAEVLRSFISAAETPEAFGVYYDLGNQFACGFPVVDEIHSLGNLIVGVHVKDRQPVTQDDIESPSVPLGEGNADFKAAFTALREVGYNRDLILQAARGKDGGEISLYREYRAYLAPIVEASWQ